MKKRIIRRPPAPLGKVLLREMQKNTARLVRIETRLCRLAGSLGVDVNKKPG